MVILLISIGKENLHAKMDKREAQIWGFTRQDHKVLP